MSEISQQINTITSLANSNVDECVRRVIRFLQALDESSVDNDGRIADVVKIAFQFGEEGVPIMLRQLSFFDQKQEFDVIDRVAGLIQKSKVFCDNSGEFVRNVKLFLLRWGWRSNALCEERAAEYLLYFAADANFDACAFAITAACAWQSEFKRNVFHRAVNAAIKSDEIFSTCANNLMLLAYFNVPLRRSITEMSEKVQLNEVSLKNIGETKLTELTVLAEILTANNNPPPTPTVRTRTKLKIAVCVSGQLRGFQEARASWEKLGLGHHDCKYFVHVWEDVGYRVPAPPQAMRNFESAKFVEAFDRVYHSVGAIAMHQNYAPIFDVFSGKSNMPIDFLRQFYNTDYVVVEDDHAPCFAYVSNSEKMHYKIEHCFDLAMSSGESYDYVIRIRPDMVVVEVLQPIWSALSELGADGIYCEQGPIIFSNGDFGIGDQFAVGAVAAMQVYSRTYSKRQNGGILRANPRSKFEGHSTLFWSCLEGGVSVAKLPDIQWGLLADAKRLSDAQVRQLLTQAIAGRSQTREDEILLAALE